MTSAPIPTLRSSPLFLPLVAALLLIFLALATSSTSVRWLGQSGYLIGAAVVAGVAFRTWVTFETPNNWGAAAGLLGLVAAAVFAATELAVVSDEEIGGGAVLIPVSWLFAATGWYAHFMGVKTLRWVITLVQVSFTFLSSLLFFILAARSDGATGTIGYGAAGVIGAFAGAIAVTGIVGRIRLELAKRKP